MEEIGEVFISYSHDSVEHVRRVLELSDKLRSEGIDCILDQYEASPPEGWPRWMDKKIRDAKFVLMICTEIYYKRVMGDEEAGKGHGVRWEGNLIYQHIYNSGTQNNKFIPVIFNPSHRSYIPTPLQGVTSYCVDTQNGYDDLYFRLLNKPKVKKPELGKLRPLPEKLVKTNPAVYLTGPIDVDLWNKAKWQATFFMCHPNRPPVLGLAFENEAAARKIFEVWHERYSENDEYEELRISIIEGEMPGEESGYSVHVGSDPDSAIQRLKDVGYEFDDDLLMMVSRINRMTPPVGSKNLEMFKQNYRVLKTYFLAPGVISKDKSQLKPIIDLGIYKGKIHFRNVMDIGDNDIDSVVLNKRGVKR
ncbi:MAG: TIR domain-containing protein [Candidatus Electryonea clarkiae]|nr:TIR domain-containing protein [Candidatus Electryonea clarkiae]